MRARPDDLSHRFGIRLAFTPYDGDRAKAVIFDKVTGEEILYGAGRNFSESYTSARFMVRGDDRRKRPRASPNRRQIRAIPLRIDGSVDDYLA